jgi:alkanesulfonate monooxygenase SsuD/methylene tetrahydromethanopterin reductase-like flavin-dependent oxidoreductase (luciferase family)
MEDAVEAEDARPTGQRGFGVVAALADHVLGEVARAAETAGYRTFWVNDGPGGDALAALRAAADATTAIRLGVGLIPFDRRSPEQIAARIGELQLPVERLTLGVGSGRAQDGLAQVRDGVMALRDQTAATVVVGALGPKMTRLAAEVADGVLVDWPTPSHARAVRRLVQQVAAEAGRSRPDIIGYVFTALGAAARGRLQADADYYSAVPAYAAHFQRMEAAPMEAAVVGETPEQIRFGLSAFDAELDETVVRATVGEDRAAAYLEVLAAAAPT